MAALMVSIQPQAGGAGSADQEPLNGAMEGAVENKMEALAYLIDVGGKLVTKLDRMSAAQAIMGKANEWSRAAGRFWKPSPRGRSRRSYDCE